MAGRRPRKGPADARRAELARDIVPAGPAALTANQGLPINDGQGSLEAGERGPSLVEDFQLREKITHFDHERIPERVVHPRGIAAHGHFQVYKSMSRLTRASFLQDPSLRTPVFVRFSAVAGSRGSSDLARDVRGFAVRFYTQDGNYDLVGNNMPVFFIQDGMKLPDLIHAVKPEPHDDMPRAASARDTFWDFISLMPESMHMIMWVMSDRAIPRSLRMMEGFGVHSFRLVDAGGRSRFVKFHWKPVLGLHSVAWDEAQKISGKDPDFHRRDLWDAIEAGNFPEWDLGIQVIEEQRLDSLGIDLLDPTKLIPEELIPVRLIGRLTLNRNPDNFFAETEQVAFHPGNLVPGIDLSDDPLLQARLSSSTDTQLLRLGGPNVHETPANRPVVPVRNSQPDGLERHAIDATHEAAPRSPTSRARSRSFFDHFSQASLFYASQSDHEKRHIVDALRFELGKVETIAIRRRMVALLAKVDRSLAQAVAPALGLEVIASDAPQNMSVPAGGDPKDYLSTRPPMTSAPSPALSMTHRPGNGIQTRKAAILVADGVDGASVARLRKALENEGAEAKIIGPRLGSVTTAEGAPLAIDASLPTTTSVLFDAVHVAGGDACARQLVLDRRVIDFVREAFAHCKTIGATGGSIDVLRLARVPLPPRIDGSALNGVVVDTGSSPCRIAAGFVAALRLDRHWQRELAVPR